ncbi:MAG: 4Fe-4S binding protein [bacterium]|nr:4Fe-4S binding protein [bacterium]
MIDWSLVGRVLFSLKYLFFILFALTGWVLLLRNRGMRSSRIAMQVLSLLLFGGVLGIFIHWFQRPFGLHPSPMCATSKGIAIPILYHKIAIPQLMLLLTAIVFTLIGGKAFCGWVCPIGALQELIGKIPGLKRFRVSFNVTNTIRTLLFLLFLVGVIVGKTIIYDHFNPFELLHWSNLGSPTVWGPTAAVLLAALFIYRPFCSFICPLGLITWLFERFSFGRIRVSDACDNCGRCIRRTDCQAMPKLVEGAKRIPDCHGCGDCLDTCPKDAISFGRGKRV